MIKVGDRICPKCGSELKYYDSVRRTIKGPNKNKKIILLARFKCSKCKSVHREIPDILIPYKHYSSKIISAIKNGEINEFTIGYEDYPSIQSMKRWKKN